ncbi:TRAP transporter small permease [Chloroflexota bacterium]
MLPTVFTFIIGTQEEISERKMKLINSARAIFDRTLDIGAALAAVLIITMTLAVSAQVFSRYVFRSPWGGLLEICTFALVYITFLSTAWVLKRERHVSMDIVTSRLNPKRRVILNIITSSVCVIICFVIFWYGTEVTWERWHSGYFVTQGFDLPDAYLLVVIPIGFFLLFIQFLRRIYGYLSVWRGIRKEEAKVIEETAGY